MSSLGVRKREIVPSSATMVTAAISATPRRAWRAAMTARISGRCQPCRLLNSTIQTCQAHGYMLNLVNIVGKSSLLSRLRKVDLGLDPLQVRFRPRGLQMLRTLPATAQQKLAKAMTSTQLISLSSLTSSHQVAKSFVGGIRNPHRRK